jgi:hypothetical protein
VTNSLEKRVRELLEMEWSTSQPGADLGVGARNVIVELRDSWLRQRELLRQVRTTFPDPMAYEWDLVKAIEDELQDRRDAYSQDREARRRVRDS